ncbi:unnamed protein product, partial [Darwinula stevensoni]
MAENAEFLLHGLTPTDLRRKLAVHGAVGLGLLSYDGYHVMTSGKMERFVLLLHRLQNIMKREAFVNADLFIEKLAEKRDLSADEEIELKAKGTYKEKIDGAFCIIHTKHPQKTYGNVQDALREMERDDIICELQQATSKQ